MRVRRRIVSATVLALAVGTLTTLTSPVANAEACGGFAGSGAIGAGLPGQIPSGRQGPAPVYNGPNTSVVGWVTGPASQNSTFDRFGISGTDLGISWDNGAGQTLMAFGDTFGDCTWLGGQWRHQTLLRSNDTNLADGLTIDDGVKEPGLNYAAQLIPTLGLAPVELTVVPTSGIAVDGVQYMSFMSVRSWNGPVWFTNYSGIATSRDNGQTWQVAPSTIRFNNIFGVDIPGRETGTSRFQQLGFMRGKDGQVYQYGTQSGRIGAVYLSRSTPDAILDPNRYEYWSPNGWTRDLNASTPVVREPNGELSVAWNDYIQRYILLTFNDIEQRLVLRTSPNPEGPWSEQTTLVPSSAIDGGATGTALYAPFIHPRSSGNSLYFTASQYSSYNVLLLRTNLDNIPR